MNNIVKQTHGQVYIDFELKLIKDNNYLHFYYYFTLEYDFLLIQFKSYHKKGDLIYGNKRC